MTTSKRRPAAPEGLGRAGRHLWRAIVEAYDLSPAELETLSQAAQVADLLARMTAELADADDLSVEGYHGQPRPHPLLAASSAQRRTLDHLLCSLALPLPGEKVGQVRSPAQVAAIRWKEQADGTGTR